MYKAVFSLRWRLRGFPAFGPDHWPRTSPDDVVGCLSFDPGKTMENLRERGGHRNQELQHQEVQKSSNQQAENSAQPSHHGDLQVSWDGFLQDASPSSPCGSCALCGESTGCRANPKQPWHPLDFCQAWCSCHLAGIPGYPWPKDANVEHGDVPSWWMM